MAETEEALPVAGTAGEPEAEPAPELVTYLLIDGENLDATLGMSVLGHRPNPEERPRWERVVEFTKRTWGCQVKPLFFLNASSGNLPMPFLQALVAMGLRPVPLSGPPGVKVVDVGIQRMLDAIGERDDNVMLGSHDGDFLPQVSALLGGDRRVGMLAFPEFLSARYTELAAAGLQVFDLEHDAKCFNRQLPRLRIIDIEAFDPTAFL
jgi:uncharacterized protein